MNSARGLLWGFYSRAADPKPRAELIGLVKDGK